MAKSPNRRRAKGLAWAFSPIAAMGFAAAFAAPSLVTAWQFPPVVVAAIMLTAPTLAIGVLLIKPRKHTLDIFGRNMWLLTAVLVFLAVQGLVTIRDGTDEAYTTTFNSLAFTALSFLNVGILVFFSRSNLDRKPIEIVINSIYIGSFIISLAQILLLYYGIENPLADDLPQQGTDALFFSALGFKITRLAMPLASGFQAGGVASMVVAVIAVNKLVHRWNPLHALALGVAAIPMLLLDVRQFILAIIVISLTSYYARDQIKLAVFGAFLPFLAPFIVAISQLFPIIGSILSSRSDRYGLFTGREFIWTQFSRYWFNATFEQNLLGNGLYGQYMAGISRTYSFMFVGWSASARPFALLHNSYIQTMADGGLLGLGLWMALIGLSIHRAQTLANTLPDPSRNAWRALVALLIAFAFVGSSETILTVYMREASPVWFSLFLAVALYGGPKSARVSPVRMAPKSDNKRMRAMATRRKPPAMAQGARQAAAMPANIPNP